MARPSVEATYPGFCKECETPYPIGTTIVPSPDGWVHESCPPAALEVTRPPCPNCWQIPSASGACGCDT